MPYAKCATCTTVIHVNTQKEEEFQERLNDENEPILCFPCFKKQQENKEKKANE